MRTRLAAVLLAALSVATQAPAVHADDAEKGIKVGGEFAGTIAASNSFHELIENGRVTTYTLLAQCSFASVIAPNNRMTVVYSGTADGLGVGTAEVTWIRCDIANQAGQSAYSARLQPGPRSETAALAGPWYVGSVAICVSAYTVLGPFPVQTIEIPRTCESYV